VCDERQSNTRSPIHRKDTLVRCFACSLFSAGHAIEHALAICILLLRITLDRYLKYRTSHGEFATNDLHSANLMSFEASLFAHTRSFGGLVVEALINSTGVQSPAGSPCPHQLSEDAIASFPLELPTLDDSLMSAAAVSAAASLRLNYAVSSSQVQSGILSLRKAWLQWHLLHMMPAGIRCAGSR